MGVLENKRKLNLGSGNFPLPDFFNIDIEEKYHPDIVADFRTLNFQDIEEIHARHILEHFSREEAIKVLKLWHLWLMVGGKLLIETPDFERICGLFASPPQRLWADREHLVFATYGSQEADWAFHRDGWYKEKFEKILPELGFKINLIKSKHNYIRYGESNTRYRLPTIVVICEKI